ncbi:MAG: SGNH/GDSL hydrolase family protein [Oscillospiraceae bacterium]|nr:SGNH/GDSL hydrolase family protein [Oscillospiraceae bacterium]
MKKFLTLLCTAAVLLSVAGCNGNTTADTTTTTAGEQTTTTASAAPEETVEAWMCECCEVNNVAKCPVCGELSPAAQDAAAAEKESVLFGGAEIPEDSKYVIEEGITDRMTVLSTYVKGNQARLAKVFKKAQSGEKITVAYLGGSITQGSSAGDKDCYARLTTNWLEEKFPDAEIEYVRAGIGATGSYIGVHRANRDVLSKNPDLIFIDFSVNDTHEHTERNINSYDSLLRKLWNHDTNPAVVTIAMTQEDGTSFQEQHSDICVAYDIPMISYREAILDVINNGHIIWDDISDDNIHPNVPGHKVLTEIITTYLQGVLDNLDTIDTENESDLSVPFTENKYEEADILTPETITPVDSTGWTTESAIFGNFGGIWTVRSNDGTFEGVNPLKFEVEAKNIGIFYGKLTTKGGTFDVVVDGQVAKTINSDFTGGWGNYVEAEEVISFPETGKHTVEIVPHTGEKALINISAIAVS